jgi:undecaprenyl-diphosphatase
LDLTNLTRTIILGAIQGLTEWLPISSTGHLKIAEHFLDLKVPVLFDVILHIGTLIVVLVFFRKDIKNILSALVRLDFKTEYGKFIPLIIVGTIPTALIGLVFGESIENTFQSILPIATAFILCGIVLYSTKAGKEKTDNISYSAALIVGVAQGIAIIPGISRSGATIAAALMLGIKREKAFKFSFLISIPAIVGALGLTLYTQFDELTTMGLGWTEVLAGMIVAMLVGYFALKLLWKILANKKFHFFALYCWLLGAVLIVLGLIGF